MAQRAGLLTRMLGGFKRRRVGPTQTGGGIGYNIIGGYLNEEEKRAELRGQQRYITLSNILSNVSIVSASVRYFLNLTARAKWTFEASEADSSGEFAERAEKMLTDDPLTPFHRIVRRSAMYRMYGFSFQEWVMRREKKEGWLTFADIEPRPQKTIERWDVSDTGTVEGVVQRAVNTLQELYLPRSKLVYLVDDTLSDSPDGLGAFRQIVTAAKDLQRFEQLEGWGFETDLRGMPIGRGPFEEMRQAVENGDLSAEERTQLETALRNFVTNHIKTPDQGILLDSMVYSTTDEREAPSQVRKWDLELLTGSNTTQEAVAKAIERKCREIARILGTEGLLLGDGDRGSHALSKDKTQNLWLMVDGSLMEIAEAYDSDLLDVAWRLNGWDPDLKPTIGHESVQFKDIEQITAALRDMAAAGAVLPMEDPVIGEVRTLLGLSAPRPPELLDPDLALGGTKPKPGEEDANMDNPSSRSQREE